MGKKIQGVVFCQIFRWNSYPEIPGTGTGVQKPEPDRNRHFDKQIRTANLLPGTPLLAMYAGTKHFFVCKFFLRTFRYTLHF